jgi:heterotetrameric sarcosine oxidase delta subunit
MSFLLPCPTCGPRPVDEYSAGGEFTTRPAPDSTPHELGRALYIKRNVAGPQLEWWYHTQGCREWFQAERDTRTNEVLRVGRPGELSDVVEAGA